MNHHLSRQSRLRLLLLPVLLGTFFVGCGDPDAPAEEAVLQEVEGAELKQTLLEDGARLQIVNFWATWCVPCRQEFPDLVKVGKEFAGEGVKVVFVSTDVEQDIPKAREFLAEMQVPWTSYVKTGDGYQFIQQFHEKWSGALPATFIFDQTGKILDYWEGISTYEELRNKVERHLAEGSV